MTLDLTFTQRANLLIFLANHTGNVGVIRMCSKVIDTIEMTAEERKEHAYRVNANGRAEWNDEGGTKTFDLPEEAKPVLRGLLEAAPIRVADLGWYEPLVEQLV